MTHDAVRLVCSGCGAQAADPSHPFTCPRAAALPQVDHVLARVVDTTALRGEADWLKVFGDPEPNPFLKYRRLLHVYREARHRGASDAAFIAGVQSLDTAVTAQAGVGFTETPFEEQPALARALGLNPPGRMWIKDETNNVSGSHKARHLMGILLWLRLLSGDDAAGSPPPLAIASCGNAALAAALVARAASWPLSVFIPPDAHPAVVAQLEQLGATLEVCSREHGATGDPCYLRFVDSVRSGSLPFTVQGSQNALALEGGLTLGYEMAAAQARHQLELDALFIQVGGGALASSVVQGLREARDLGVTTRMPRVHLVQTEGAAPLHRAYQGLADHLGASSASPTQRAASILALPAAERAQGYVHAAGHRAQFMWPWEHTPRSLATGILDDETYDWLACVRAMMETGGFPVVVSEADLETANRLAGSTTGIAVDPTGSAGLAGAVALQARGLIPHGDQVAVLFTGIER